MCGHFNSMQHFKPMAQMLSFSTCTIENDFLKSIMVNRNTNIFMYEQQIETGSHCPANFHHKVLGVLLQCVFLMLRSDTSSPVHYEPHIFNHCPHMNSIFT